MDTTIAAPCRNCSAPVDPHCEDNPACDWWLCPACSTYGSYAKQRMVVPQGKGPEVGSDGVRRIVSQFKVVDYGEQT